jgi:hypothetical protein
VKLRPQYPEARTPSPGIRALVRVKADLSPQGRGEPCGEAERLFTSPQGGEVGSCSDPGEGDRVRIEWCAA